MNLSSTDATSASHTPPLVWPEFTNDKAQLEWWLACVKAYRAEWAKPASLTPVNAQEIDALEQRLTCPLPTPLRTYHENIGVLELSESLCSVTPVKYSNIEPLLDAYPGITDILEDTPESTSLWTLVNQLIVFGDYLGNGNLWCFHRNTGEVWYFDHDSSPMLTKMFTDVGQYLDILMFMCLLFIHDEEGNEELLRERLGDEIVEKWMY